MGLNINPAGEFQSSKHNLPADRVRLNVARPDNWLGLLIIADAYQDKDPEFADDLRQRVLGLATSGKKPGAGMSVHQELVLNGPRWLAYWGALRAAAHATCSEDGDGKYTTDCPSDVDIMEMLKRVGDWPDTPGTTPPATESLASQVDRLADFILAEIPGEPSQSEGAIDTAIRLLAQRNGAGRIATERRRQIAKGRTAEADTERYGPGDLLAAAHLILLSVPESATTTAHADGRIDWAHKLIAETDDSERLIEIAGALLAAELDAREFDLVESGATDDGSGAE